MCFFFFIHSFACIMAGGCPSAGLLPRKIAREDWSGSFTVRSASKQCELVPTRDFWIRFFKSKFKMLVGLCPIPFRSASCDAGCAFVPNAFITKRRDRPEFFSKEGLWSVVVYRDFVFSAALFLCAARPHCWTGKAAILPSKSQRKMQGRGIVLNTNPTPYYKGIGYWNARMSPVM